MKIKKSDALFALQMILMVFFVGGQAHRMTQSVEGISPTWLIFGEIFCIINMSLAWLSWRDTPGRAVMQLLITHTGWTVGIGLLVGLLLVRMSEVGWGWYDTLASTVVVITIIGIFTVAWRRKLSITDPIIRGWLAGIFRGIPHFAMAYKISLVGGDGIAAIAVWIAHATTLIRIGQLAFAVREAGWNRSLRGMAISELSNEITWIIVTIVWIFW
ncbi:hypothetical protein HN358_04360 [Candidatus Uhrbacteria bacterium]|nr:hypothetical protein [Candidatus Uhrbacteria bacterium]MBT7717017.1 hypothetical protein [Candidatus Uhrbacteria bacterium]